MADYKHTADLSSVFWPIDTYMNGYISTYEPKNFLPEPKKIIFNPPATIVYWDDGTKTVVQCSKDDFSEEFGYAMACMRRLYGSRSKFKAQFKDAKRTYPVKEQSAESSDGRE